jgi:excisionase family DNA binding protein
MLRLDALSGRLEPLLVRRIERLAMAVERGDESAWRPLCESLVALEALGRVTLPERRGALLSVGELAERLGVTAKSARRMVAEGRLRPAVRAGRLLRFRGDERPVGPAAPRARIRESEPAMASPVANGAVNPCGERSDSGPQRAVAQQPAHRAVAQQPVLKGESE